MRRYEAHWSEQEIRTHYNRVAPPQRFRRCGRSDMRDGRAAIVRRESGGRDERVGRADRAGQEPLERYERGAARADGPRP